MHLVDTHLHLWDTRQFPYSWCSGIPTLNRSFLLDDYLAAAGGCGIGKAVFVECDVDDPHQLAEAQSIQRLADDHALIAGIVASGRPERPGFAEHLDHLAPLSKLRGIRRVLHIVPDTVSQQSLFRENVRRLPERGLSFDLCVLARQLPVARALVDSCPEVMFVLDHCGVPDIGSGTFDPWRDCIRSIAERPNVACKISGLIAYADPSTCVASTFRPWMEHVIECFGWDRIMWGGDWPVCTLTASLLRWVEVTREILASVDDDKRANFFHRNAEKLYRV